MMIEGKEGGAKEFVAQVMQAFSHQNSKTMNNLFRAFYKENQWDSEANKWEGSVSMGQYEDGSDLFNSFSRMLDLVRKYQAAKLKNGIVHGFRIHMDVLSAVLKVFESVKG